MSVHWIYLGADGQRHALDVAPGTHAMNAAVAAGIGGILGECGGSAMCATCHVEVVGGPLAALPAVSATENDMLDCTAAPRRPQSRLACQIVANQELDGLVFQLPPCQA